MTTPELEGPRFKLLNLNALKKHCGEVLDFEPKKRTIRGAYEEVLEELTRRKHETPYVCGYCNAQIDGEMERCWACGSVIDDDEEDPKMTDAEVSTRAKKLGIDPEGEPEEVKAAVEAAERSRREKTRDADLSGIEAERINEKLTEQMPDGWRKSKANQYTSYWDPNGKRRIAVFTRGLNVHFSVDDGLLDGLEHLEYLDPEERKRRHAGRTNYLFTGEIAREAVEICAKVMGHYSGE
jgi:hypothetical protein